MGRCDCDCGGSGGGGLYRIMGGEVYQGIDSQNGVGNRQWGKVEETAPCVNVGGGRSVSDRYFN